MKFDTREGSPQSSILVRFDETAMPLERLFETLTRQTGIRLLCAPEVKNETLLLHVRDLPLGDVMERIAEVIGASWRQVGNAWRLERSEQMVRAQQEQDLSARVAIIAQYLPQILSPLQKPWNETVLHAAVTRRRKGEDSGQYDPMDDHLDPLYRAFLRCLSDVSPRALALIPIDGRVVFATQPAPMQKALGKGAQSALAKVMEEQAFFSAVLRRAGMDLGFEDTACNWDRHDVWGRHTPYKTTPARVLLIVERTGKSIYEIKLTLLDKKRQTMVNYDVSSDFLPLSLPWVGRKSSPKSPQFSRSAQSRTLVAIEGWHGDKPRLTADALRLLTAPEQYEPLGMVASDGYLALARAKNRNLIAALPDCLQDEFFLDDCRTLDDVRNLPSYEPSMHIADRNGWLIITPPFPYEARLSYGDRATLGQVVRRIVQRGSYRIEDIAEFAVNSGDAPMNHFGNAYLRSVCKGEGVDWGNWTLLALYGSLTVDQQKALLAGHALPYTNLTQRQRHFAERAVFGPTYNCWSTGSAPVPIADAANADIYFEPTECNPRGLPDGGNIRVSRKRQYVVLFRGPGKTEYERLYWRMLENPPTFSSGPGIRIPAGGIDAFRYDVRHFDTVAVEIDVTPWCRIKAEYREADLPPTGPPVPLSGLPPDIQKRVKNELGISSRHGRTTT